MTAEFLGRVRAVRRTAAVPSIGPLRGLDGALLAAVGVAVGFGLLMIYSATLRGGAVESPWDDLVVKQAVFAAVGALALAAAVATDHRALQALWPWIYLGMAAVLGLVLATGDVGLGAQRWFELGIASIQPSEFVKVGMVVCLAAYFARFDARRLRHVLGSLALTGAMALLVLLQPNLSTALLLAFIWLGIAFAAGLRMLHLGLLALLAGPALWAVMAAGVLQDYQLQRVSAWLDPSADPLGMGFQNAQTLIAVGNGGLFGIGFANGSQSQGGWLPLLHTDNLYALVAEELGFVGGVAVLVLLGFIVQRVVQAGARASDRSGALICAGVASWLLAQTLVNVGVVLQLLPVTGLSLPFMSYGGSSLVALMLGIGLVQGVRLRRRRDAR